MRIRSKINQVRGPLRRPCFSQLRRCLDRKTIPGWVQTSNLQDQWPSQGDEAREKSQVLGTEPSPVSPSASPQIAARPGPEPPLGRGKTGMQNLTLKTHWMIIPKLVQIWRVHWANEPFRSILMHFAGAWAYLINGWTTHQGFKMMCVLPAGQK